VEKYYDIAIMKFKEGTMVHFASDCESVNSVIAGFINCGLQCVTDDLSEKFGCGILA
jgi:hypothetical protein